MLVKFARNGALVDEFLNAELTKNLSSFLRLLHVHFNEAAIGFMDSGKRLARLKMDDVHLGHGLVFFAPTDNRDLEHLVAPDAGCVSQLKLTG